MKIRRVVTGHDAQGRSVFVDDGDAPRAHSFAHIPGHAFAQVWQTAPAAGVPHAGGDLTAARGSLLPAPGASSLLVVDFQPDAVMASPDMDFAAAGAEMGAMLPGLIDVFEQDSPGMHTTDTIDYGFVLDGEIWLELDNGAQRLLKAGDIAVQNGTRHAWRNKTDKPVRVAFVMMGAARRGG